MSKPFRSRAAGDYDVVIVGSGAAGGMAAFALATAGVRVAVLEAGRSYDPVTETPMDRRAKDAPLRAVETPDKAYGYYNASLGGGWDIPGEPYAVAEGSQFRWFRSRMLGGRTNHWGRVTPRFAAHDFKGRSSDGLGVDWPIGYDELAPYYDKVQRLVGIFGANHDLDDIPNSPPDAFQPPPKPRAYELLIQRGGAKLGRPVVPVPTAVLTRRLGNRPPCYYATPCKYGCAIGANFQSTTVFFPPALASGNLSVIANAMAYEIEVDASGRARGVHFVDKSTGAHRFVGARAVMLGASSVESGRILLNSRSASFPNGLGNSAGLVGRYLMDNVGSLSWAQFPQLENLPPYNDEGVSLPHVWIPWWGRAEQRAGKLDFPRGYHIEVVGGRKEPSHSQFTRYLESTPGAYGTRLKEEARRYYGSFVRFTASGEMLPNDRSYFEIDPQIKDRWGIPVVRFHYGWSEHELRQFRHAQKSMREIITASGGRVVGSAPETPVVPGSVIHELGGSRMGHSARDSVLDKWGRVWGSGNLFVIDGGAFPSNPHKNPTLTITALAWRAADRLRELARRGEL